MTLPSISAVVPTLDSERTLSFCLRSLTRYQREGYIKEIVVVDGGSQDNTIRIAKQFPVRLIYQSRNLWSSHPNAGIYKAYQDGLEATDSELILNIDSDAYLGEGFFPRALSFFNDERLGLLGCWPKSARMRGIGKAMGERGRLHALQLKKAQAKKSGVTLYTRIVTGESRYIPVTGPCYIYRREPLLKTGGFYGLIEEHELNQRIRKNGLHSLWWIEAPVYHFYRSTLRELFKERRRDASLVHNLKRISLLTAFAMFAGPLLRFIFEVAYSLYFINPQHVAVGLVEMAGIYAGIFLTRERKDKGLGHRARF
jgi:glycosyltransferase involved in cell wall biosynthesis